MIWDSDSLLRDDDDDDILISSDFRLRADFSPSNKGPYTLNQLDLVSEKATHQNLNHYGYISFHFISLHFEQNLNTILQDL